MSEIRFLNIDLEITSQKDFTPVIEEWGSDISVSLNEFREGLYYCSFETTCSGLNQIVAKYHSLVMGLSDSSRKLWDEALNRELDIGYEGGTSPNNFHSKISKESLELAVEIGAYFTITIYPVPGT